MNKIVILSFISLLCLTFSLFGQGDADYTCQIHKVLPPLSIERPLLENAKNIQDIHKQYKPDWVNSFIDVELHTYHQGVKKIAKATNDLLTAEQMKNLRNSDVGSDIYILVNYIPENNLSHNDSKKYDATFRINPDQDAYFKDGVKALNNYLKNEVLQNVAEDTYSQYALAAVRFTVDEEGRIENVTMQESSKDENVDALMKQAICDMPNWTPAQFANGEAVSQDFVLTLGDMKSCVANTLDIKRF